MKSIALEVLFVLTDFLFAGFVMLIYGLIPIVGIFYCVGKYHDLRNKLTEDRVRNKIGSDIHAAAWWIDPPLQDILHYVADTIADSYSKYPFPLGEGIRNIAKAKGSYKGRV